MNLTVLLTAVNVFLFAYLAGENEGTINKIAEYCDTNPKASFCNRKSFKVLVQQQSYSCFNRSDAATLGFS